MSNREDVGRTFKILIEGDSKKSDSAWRGRNSQNKVVVFPKADGNYARGDYAWVKITGHTQATLIGTAISAPESDNG
jgi:tRNA-2-methylthio-N6-dimethylallyladenosine synthase